MIESEDFARPARVLVQDGEERDWRRLWLRKRPTWRIVFVGYIERMDRNPREGTSLQLVDAMSRLKAHHHWNALDILAT
jgi:hypothetical protein